MNNVADRDYVIHPQYAPIYSEHYASFERDRHLENNRAAPPVPSQNIRAFLQNTVPRNAVELADYLKGASEAMKRGMEKPRFVMWRVLDGLARVPPDLQTPAIKNFLVSVNKTASRKCLTTTQAETIMNCALKGVKQDLYKEKMAASLAAALKNPAILQHHLFGNSESQALNHVSLEASTNASAASAVFPRDGCRLEPDYFRKIEYYLSTFAPRRAAKGQASVAPNGNSPGIAASLRLGGIHPPHTLPLVNMAAPASGKTQPGYESSTLNGSNQPLASALHPDPTLNGAAGRAAASPRAPVPIHPPPMPTP